MAWSEPIDLREINLADFGPEDKLFVEQMIEPIVMGPDGLVRPGTVLLGNSES